MTPTRADVALIPVGINGIETHMLLDTGGGVSSLNEKTADSLKLTREDAAMKILDLNGRASHKFVRVNAFELGGLKGKNIDLMIWPGANLPFDGLIAGDLLSRYDVELNFATRKLNLFSPDHCDGKVIYWPTTAVAVVPFSMARPVSGDPNEPGSIQTGPDSHIRVPVMLDGKKLSAIVDTGATYSTLSTTTAKALFGITADSPGATAMGGAGSQRFGYIFHTLTFDGIAVSNPHVLVHPDIMGKNDPDNEFSIDSHIRKLDDGLDPDFVIGMDVLKHLHLFIAYHERKLYITPPDQPSEPRINPVGSP